jgi:putative colanic acid biosynthesis acetyltransferase WcaF
MIENVDFPKYQDRLSYQNKAARFVWGVVWLVLFRPFGLPFFHKWRNLLLKLFGAKIGKRSIVHSSVKIWAPWNLEIGQHTVIGPGVICYNPDKIILGSKVSVSQRAHLCTASHDFTDRAHPLVTQQIVVHDFSWIATEAFVAMGVTIAEGVVVGARAVVTKDVEPWTVVAGNPAKFIKHRLFKDS